MKRFKSITVLLLFLFSFQSASGQVVKEGDVLIDAYYGFPNLFKVVLKAAYLNSGEELDVQIGGLGPLGARGEYLISDEIGLGLDISYRSLFINYREADQAYNDNTGQYEDVFYDYTFTTAKLGFMLTFNYHFVINDQLDAYGMIGAGYGNRSLEVESTNPDFVPEKIAGVVPISARVGAGLRYFFTDNIGINASIGFGHSGLLNAGLSFKL